MALKTRSRPVTLTISTATGGSGDIMITVSLDTVVVEGAGYSINQRGSVARQGCGGLRGQPSGYWIRLAKDVRFLVLFTTINTPVTYRWLTWVFTSQMDGGCRPQHKVYWFQHADMSVTVVKDHVTGGARRTNKEGLLVRGIPRWGSEHMPVTLQDKTLKDTVRKRHLGKCWVVPKAEIQRLLGHPYESYVVDHV
ncbi:inter-alpha-trypsin inhibitor heavy chain H6 [Lates japonicus]|uniref:Inter-alpha-trypsin inhibitor heavy chain H6 n=1 Tax=Lates japonicus TaxID=270547 RepID=A0AAD3MAT2_LATJO|nr:inter-alpha-trypsin inhibitor heavy chain H6 [Lates japonicus]